MYLSAVVSNSAPKGYPAPLICARTEDDVLTAKRIGFPAVQVHCSWPWDIDWNALAAFVKAQDMKIDCIGTGLAAGRHNLSMTTQDDYLARKTMQAMRAFVDASAATDSAVILGSIRGAVVPGKSYDESMEIFAGRLCSLMEYAEQKGVSVVVEAINRYDAALLRRAEEAVSLVERVGSPRLKIHLDTYHMNIEEQNLPDAIRLCKGKLGHIHFSDSDRWYPGHAHIDFGAVVDALYEIGYNGSIGFEYWPLPDPYTAAKEGFDHISPLLKQK